LHDKLATCSAWHSCRRWPPRSWASPACAQTSSWTYGVVRKPQATQRIHILALRSFVIKEHIDTIVGKVSNNKARNHHIRVKIIDRWLQMPIMRHGEATTEILDLNLNRGHCGRGCHVDVTSIISTVVIITIEDDSIGNRLIMNVLLNEFLDKSWHCTTLDDGSIHMSLLLQEQVITFVRGKVISLQLDIDTNATVAYILGGAS
jgi:hypothetical protein